MEIVKNEYRLKSGVVLKAVQGDLTKQQVDAIVNSSSSRLPFAGGVAGAIVRAGGREIQDEAQKSLQDLGGELKVGKALATSAGRLDRVKFVIHVCSPVWNNGTSQEEEKLADCMNSILTIADEKGVTSLALPGISSGNFGFPKDKCADILVAKSVEYLSRNQSSKVKQIIFVNIDDETSKFFADKISTLKEGGDLLIMEQGTGSTARQGGCGNCSLF
eukprot:TRINITY_DN8773_c0_g1_i1.p1 TRINITY_DN8773_c0_g1~~TRINITY_DN8773_c0_g1_i1.p1  ORF type:complete len:218 (-),score=44.94 TRINITY_DN8773_c0_g1_i1:24-677(-)